MVKSKPSVSIISSLALKYTPGADLARGLKSVNSTPKPQLLIIFVMLQNPKLGFAKKSRNW